MGRANFLPPKSPMYQLGMFLVQDSHQPNQPGTPVDSAKASSWPSGNPHVQEPVSFIGSFQLLSQGRARSLPQWVQLGWVEVSLIIHLPPPTASPSCPPKDFLVSCLNAHFRSSCSELTPVSPIVSGVFGFLFFSTF